MVLYKVLTISLIEFNIISSHSLLYFKYRLDLTVKVNPKIIIIDNPKSKRCYTIARELNDILC